MWTEIVQVKIRGQLAADMNESSLDKTNGSSARLEMPTGVKRQQALQDIGESLSKEALRIASLPDERR
jgi:hypothetical protein